MQNEENLLRRAQERDPQALSSLYEENFDKIYRYVAIKVGNRMEAEDITQQVFVKALQSVSTYKWQGTPFSAWLFRIAHNQIVDYLRVKTRQATVPLEEWVPDNSCDPQKSAEHNCTMEELAVATKELTPAQQEVISLRFAGGLSIAEVAKTMGKSEGAIKALQHSAIVALRKVLQVEVVS